jgi:hypothetical protein
MSVRTLEIVSFAIRFALFEDERFTLLAYREEHLDPK